MEGKHWIRNGIEYIFTGHGEVTCPKRTRAYALGDCHAQFIIFKITASHPFESVRVLDPEDRPLVCTEADPFVIVLDEHFIFCIPGFQRKFCSLKSAVDVSCAGLFKIGERVCRVERPEFP